MKIFVDFHHNSLLRSFVLLFENRLNIDVYRPIGLEWFYHGYWAINDQLDTAKQFLDILNVVPSDNTPQLNSIKSLNDGVFNIYDPGNLSTHKAITFDRFKEEKFDFIISSIPEHIERFRKLIKEYQPTAKLIVQIGNNWDSNIFDGHNVLASVKPGLIRDANVVYYHQEFDLDIFHPRYVDSSNYINSYINILQNMQQGWKDFCNLESILSKHGIDMKSYGGQCRDGNASGPLELSNLINNSLFTFHVKDGGDGYGHILYNSFACGKPVITRKSFYEGKLGEELLNDSTFLDLDKNNVDDIANMILQFVKEKDSHKDLCKKSYYQFVNTVSFEDDAHAVGIWLENL